MCSLHWRRYGMTSRDAAPDWALCVMLSTSTWVQSNPQQQVQCVGKTSSAWANICLAGIRPATCTHHAILQCSQPVYCLLVQVRGAPRTNAAAKDSEWVRQRQELERDKPADVNEVCCDDLDVCPDTCAWTASHTCIECCLLGLAYSMHSCIVYCLCASG